MLTAEGAPRTIWLFLNSKNAFSMHRNQMRLTYCPPFCHDNQIDFAKTQIFSKNSFSVYRNQIDFAKTLFSEAKHISRRHLTVSYTSDVSSACRCIESTYHSDTLYRTCVTVKDINIKWYVPNLPYSVTFFKK